MKKLWLIVIVILLIALVAGAAYLYSSDIPAPQEHIERSLPVDRNGR